MHHALQSGLCRGTVYIQSFVPVAWRHGYRLGIGKLVHVECRQTENRRVDRSSDVAGSLTCHVQTSVRAIASAVADGAVRALGRD
jgi:hypothetical protein